MSDFLMVIKIHSMTSFGGEVQLSVPCHKILQYVKDPYSMQSRLNSRTFLAKFLPASLLGVSASNCQRALVGDSGMIITQMGKHIRSVMVAVYGIPWEIPPCKQLQ
jgi:hypothetical protein